MVRKNSKKLAIFKKNGHELWPFFSVASNCDTSGRITFAGANNYSPLLERVLAQTIAADGEARHVGRSLLAEVFVHVDFREVLT